MNKFIGLFLTILFILSIQKSVDFWIDKRKFEPQMKILAENKQDISMTEEEFIRNITQQLECMNLKTVGECKLSMNGESVHKTVPTNSSEMGKVLECTTSIVSTGNLRSAVQYFLEVDAMMMICEYARTHRLSFQFDGLCMYFSEYKKPFSAPAAIQLKFSMQEYQALYQENLIDNDMPKEEKIRKLSNAYVKKHHYTRPPGYTVGQTH